MSEIEILSREEVERGATLDCEMGRATFAALNAALVLSERAREAHAELVLAHGPEVVGLMDKAYEADRAADAAVADLKTEGWVNDE